MIHPLPMAVIIAAVTTLPAQASPSQDAIKRELLRLNGATESLSPAPALALRSTSHPSPEAATTLTIAAPLGLVVFSGTALGPIGAALGAVAAPLTMGVGHAYAGDLPRGTWVSLGGTAVLLSSFMVSYRIGEGMAGPGAGYYPGLMPGLLGSLVVTTGFWIWAALDAGETARRTQRETRADWPLP